MPSLAPVVIVSTNDTAQIDCSFFYVSENMTEGNSTNVTEGMIANMTAANMTSMVNDTVAICEQVDPFNLTNCNITRAGDLLQRHKHHPGSQCYHKFAFQRHHESIYK